MRMFIVQCLVSLCIRLSYISYPIQRIDILRKNGSCSYCTRTAHPGKECGFFKCFTCRKPGHSDVLCNEKLKTLKPNSNKPYKDYLAYPNNKNNQKQNTTALVTEDSLDNGDKKKLVQWGWAHLE